MKKKESIVSNSEDKPPEDIRQPFKEVNEDVYELDGFVEGE